MTLALPSIRIVPATVRTFVLAFQESSPLGVPAGPTRQVYEEAGIKPRAVEGLDDYSWVLIDYGDFVVHVFLTDTREFYALERLWSDAARVQWEAAV